MGSTDHYYRLSGSALLLTSGRVVWLVLSLIARVESRATGSDSASVAAGKFGVSQKALDTGAVVGKCENFLILTFMLLDAYTALALIFAAKTVVRREDISTNTLFYLAGTMVNVTYSILIGALMNAVLWSC
ncbi:MAG: hypothetical protein JW945_04570 [Methanomicrobia archaeon]|nr:hypothetical protein [Methanomicrobia archaeon]